MQTYLHQHKLEHVNPLTVYSDYGGGWKCDRCHGEGNATEYPFHCRQCSFDVCCSCVVSSVKEQNSKAHQHLLLFQEQKGLWRCAACKKTNEVLRETFSNHCSTCPDFDICRKCYEPKQHPIHIHVLQLVDTSLMYAQTGGTWMCDTCGNESKDKKFSHHCIECAVFNVCHECFTPQITSLHSHPLYKTNALNVYENSKGEELWNCDNCASANTDPDNHPWHCQSCKYDLCQKCMRGTIEGDGLGAA